MEDVKCEEKCHNHYEKMSGYINKVEIISAINENDACLSNCLIPKKGNSE